MVAPDVVRSGLTDESLGAVVSTINRVAVRALLTLPAASVTVAVQLYVPSARALNVMVFTPDSAEDVVLVHPPPYVIVPASVELKDQSGVMSVVGVVTADVSVRVGAVASYVMDNVGEVKF